MKRETTMNSMKALAGAMIVAAAGCAGCASTAPDHFYRLADRRDTGVEQPGRSSSARSAPVVAVAAVSVPDLVDRPQIVTLGPGSRVQLSEQNRWAEPVKLAIGRLVAERIGVALPGALVSAYPADAGVEPGYRVTLNVQRFDSELGSAASDTVLWTVRRTDDGLLRSGRRAMSSRPADAGFDAMVDAHAGALALIGDEIARAIIELEGGR